MQLLDVDYTFACDNLKADARGFREDGPLGYRSPEDLFQSKFRHWRGKSGRSHAFSVYAPKDCPAYADAVVIVAARQAPARRPLDCVDLGPFPENRLARLRQRYGDEVEFHIHVLAERAADRRTLIADLAPDEP